jgi:hypothetical protein
MEILKASRDWKKIFETLVQSIGSQIFAFSTKSFQPLMHANRREFFIRDHSRLKPLLGCGSHCVFHWLKANGQNHPLALAYSFALPLD